MVIKISSSIILFFILCLYSCGYIPFDSKPNRLITYKIDVKNIKDTISSLDTIWLENKISYDTIYKQSGNMDGECSFIYDISSLSTSIDYFRKSYNKDSIFKINRYEKHYYERINNSFLYAKIGLKFNNKGLFYITYISGNIGEDKNNYNESFALNGYLNIKSCNGYLMNNLKDIDNYTSYLINDSLSKYGYTVCFFYVK